VPGVIPLPPRPPQLKRTTDVLQKPDNSKSYRHGQYAPPRHPVAAQGISSRGCSSLPATVVTMAAMNRMMNPMTSPPTDLADIPVVDVRDGGPLRHAVDASARARVLRDGCLAWLAPPAQLLLPALDALTRRWLQRSRTPYLADAEAIATALGFSGIWFPLGSLHSTCTAKVLPSRFRSRILQRPNTESMSRGVIFTFEAPASEASPLQAWFSV